MGEHSTLKQEDYDFLLNLARDKGIKQCEEIVRDRFFGAYTKTEYSIAFSGIEDELRQEDQDIRHRLWGLGKAPGNRNHESHQRPREPVWNHNTMHGENYDYLTPEYASGDDKPYYIYPSDDSSDERRRPRITEKGSRRRTKEHTVEVIGPVKSKGSSFEATGKRSRASKDDSRHSFDARGRETRQLDCKYIVPKIGNKRIWPEDLRDALVNFKDGQEKSWKELVPIFGVDQARLRKVYWSHIDYMREKGLVPAGYKERGRTSWTDAKLQDVARLGKDGVAFKDIAEIYDVKFPAVKQAHHEYRKRQDGR